MRMRLWALAGLLVFPWMAFGQQQADPCDIKKGYEDLQKQVALLGPTPPKPAEPKGSDGKTLTKAEVEQALKAAIEVKNKAATAEEEAAVAVDAARLALVRFDDQKGERRQALTMEVMDLGQKISIARDAMAKVSPNDQRALSDFKRNEIDPLAAQITGQMPGIPIEQALTSVGDFMDFKNSEIDAIKKSIEDSRESIKIINAKTVPGVGDASVLAAADNNIAEKTAELPKAIERARADVRKTLGDYGKKQTEYANKLKQLYPDEETQNLIANLATLESDLNTKQQELNPLDEERRKLVVAMLKASEKRDGSKKPFEDAKLKVMALEMLLAQVEEYEKWIDAEKKRADAVKALATKKTEYDNAVTAKNKELATAQQVVADVPSKLAAERAKLLGTEKPKFLKSAAFLESQQHVRESVKGLDAAQKKVAVDRWKKEQRSKLNQIVAALLQPTRDAENRQLTLVLNNLSAYNCWTDARSYLAEVKKLMEQHASVEAGMDFTYMDDSGWEEIPFELVDDSRDAVFVGSWKCTCNITIELNADHTGSWVDSRGGPPGSMYESGKFTGTWSASGGDAVTLSTSVAKYGRRGGSVTFRLIDGKLRDPWGDTYVR